MKYQLILLLIIVLSACKSPSKLLEEGNYKSAFNKAVREIKNGKNIEENLKVIEAAAEIKVNEALLYTEVKTNSANVKDWIKTQTKLYKLLEDIGEANLLTSGSISEPYDMLCAEKKEIDYQIVEHYFDNGHNHLDRFYNEGNKIDARNAYYSFKDCEKHEGQLFFKTLIDNLDDAHQNGIVYYVSNYGRIANKLFLKPLPKGAEFLPDCDIFIDYGIVSIDESKSTKSEEYTKEVETGQETETDTSGNVTYIPIYETITATVVTTTVTLTATVNTYINSKNVTGQCSVESSYFSTSMTDSYEEVSIEGDEDALDHNVTTTDGEPSFFSSNLKSSVLRKADEGVGI
jgi:hypothetical protein